MWGMVAAPGVSHQHWQEIEISCDCQGSGSRLLECLGSAVLWVTTLRFCHGADALSGHWCVPQSQLTCGSGESPGVSGRLKPQL